MIPPSTTPPAPRQIAMSSSVHEMEVELAMADLVPFMEDMPQEMVTEIGRSLRETPPSGWSSCVRTQLLQTERAAYWRGLFEQTPAPAPAARAGHEAFEALQAAMAQGPAALAAFILADPRTDTILSAGRARAAGLRGRGRGR